MSDQPYESILYATDTSGVARLTLNRPAAMNAYTSAMCDELCDALQRFERSDDQRVLILTGAGRAFCAGGDVRSEAERAIARERQLGHAVVLREGMQRVIRLLHHLDKPTVAMVNGPAVAGGLTLALLCDLRIVSRDAVLGDTSGRTAMVPEEGGTWLFQRFMGLDKALRMSLLAEVYSADEAHSLGLVTEVVEAGRLAARVTQVTAEIASRSPLTCRIVKGLMHRARESTFDEALRAAADAVLVINESEDVAEGVRAFVEKRQPRFTGR